MKKLAFLFVASAAISFASCVNKSTQAETAVDTDTIATEEIEEVNTAVEADSVAADTTASDTTAAEAPAAE